MPSNNNLFLQKVNRQILPSWLRNGLSFSPWLISQPQVNISAYYSLNRLTHSLTLMEIQNVSYCRKLGKKRIYIHKACAVHHDRETPMCTFYFLVRYNNESCHHRLVGSVVGGGQDQPFTTKPDEAGRGTEGCHPRLGQVTKQQRLVIKYLLQYRQD